MSILRTISIAKHLQSSFFIFLILVLILTGNTVSACKPAPEKVSIGFTVADTTVLLMMAADQHYYQDNGLDVTLKTYDTALNALQGMKTGEVDIAENAEFPLVAEVFKKTDLNIIAGVDRFDIVNLAVRTDRGILNVSDLRGKTVGVPKGAVAEFYFGRFLELNGISSDDVKVINLPFQQAVDTLPGGAADAFLIRAKDIGPVKDKLKNGVKIWSCQNGQMGFDVLSARTKWVSEHTNTVIKLLKALRQAEMYVISHPAETRNFIHNRLNYDSSLIDLISPLNSYSLSLDQTLMTAMEDEARWMIKNGLTTEKDVPLFNAYIYENALKVVKPEAVNIIR